MAKTDEKIKQLQLFEQNLQVLGSQKQQFQAQLIEINSALSELEGTDEAYKIIGNIMVRSDKEKLLSDLKEKKEMVEIRIKNLEKQEDQIKQRTKKLQQEVMKEMSDEE